MRKYLFTLCSALLLTFLYMVSASPQTRTETVTLQTNHKKSIAVEMRISHDGFFLFNSTYRSKLIFHRIFLSNHTFIWNMLFCASKPSSTTLLNLKCRFFTLIVFISFAFFANYLGGQIWEVINLSCIIIVVIDAGDHDAIQETDLWSGLYFSIPLCQYLICLQIQATI